MPFLKKFFNADAVVIKLLKLMNITISSEEIINELRMHPDYPDLLAINDVLNNYGLNSGAYKIESDDLKSVPRPFIAHTVKSGLEFILVNDITEDSIILSDQNKSNYPAPIENFLHIFSGVVLVPNEDFLKPRETILSKLGFNSWRNPIILGLLVIVFFACLTEISYSFSQFSWQAISSIIIKTVGLCFSVLLLIQSIDKNNPLVQTLCTGNGSRNCNAILSSDAANVFKGLTWSEVGFFYFTGTWLLLLFQGSHIAVLQSLAIINILCLPYTIYSIYFQAKVVKQWCILCCTIQALLWCEFFSLSTSLNGKFVLLSFSELRYAIIFFSLPVVTWLFVKPLILKIQSVGPLKNQLQRFKFNNEVFSNLLEKQPRYMTPSPEWSIVIGNSEAENVITMVSNPFCAPCSNTHKIIEDWLLKNQEIQFRIIFTAGYSNGGEQEKVITHLIALNQLDDKNVVSQALSDWYNQSRKSYSEWSKKYPVQSNESVQVILNKQYEWCTIADIVSTPTLLVNGARLPDSYQLKDIKYMFN